MQPSPSARLTIDLAALAHNYGVLRAAAGGVETAAVVKADGYGLGAGPVGRALWAAGARSFFVARLTEGEALRTALGPQRPAAIYVLDGLSPGTGPRLASADLIPALSSLSQIAEARAHATAGSQAFAVALHVDTGMNRQGLTPDEAAALAADPAGLTGLDVVLLMSHLGSATEPAAPRNHAQLERFVPVRALFPKVRASFPASAGLFLGADYRFDMVRAGISLYGGGPEERPDPRLRAVVTLEAPILDIRQVAAGETLGYGSSVVLQKPTRLAVVAAGYADGVIRAAKAGGYGWLDGARRPFLIVNMDLLALDIGDAQARPGDMVELLGPNALLDDLAAAAGTVAHECLVRLGPRPERIYLGGD
jgi:alanine racemase